MGDDVEKTVTGMGLVRGLELISSVTVPPPVSRVVAHEQNRRAAPGSDEPTDSDSESQRALHDAVTTYVRLVFEKILTERWAGAPSATRKQGTPKRGGPSSTSGPGRYKFGISGYTRTAGSDVATAVRTQPRLTHVIGLYVAAVLARAFPPPETEGRRVDCLPPRAGPAHGPLSPHWAAPLTDSRTGAITFGKTEAGWGWVGCIARAGLRQAHRVKLRDACGGR